METESREVRVCLEHISPEAARPDSDPSIVFKAGSIRGQNLYLCTQTEILTYRLPDFERIGYISLPMFNDCHHVCPTREGDLLVANTGLDMVVRVSSEGEILEEWNVLGETAWVRFSKEVDYRKIPTTKPHLSHPNYVFMHEGDIWVTRFEQKDAICLTQPESRIEIGLGKPHDGHTRKDRVYFTTVNGMIVIADLNSHKVKRVINLNRIDGQIRALGWCRGINILDDERILVGFSRLRPTQWRENLRGIKGGLSLVGSLGFLPTRIALYNIKKNTCDWTMNLEDWGMNVVFSILKAN